MRPSWSTSSGFTLTVAVIEALGRKRLPAVAAATLWKFDGYGIEGNGPPFLRPAAWSGSASDHSEVTR